MAMQDSSSATSVGTSIASAPPDFNSSTIPAPESRSAIAIFAPSAAMARANAAPIPCAAPVTIATRPSKPSHVSSPSSLPEPLAPGFPSSRVRTSVFIETSPRRRWAMICPVSQYSLRTARRAIVSRSSFHSPRS